MVRMLVHCSDKCGIDGQMKMDSNEDGHLLISEDELCKYLCSDEDLSSDNDHLECVFLQQ